MADRIGQQLGHYRLIRKLGSGGFADVYQAEHIYLNTSAAVKLLNTSLISGDVQNFHNEARTIARLIHPHIVRVLDFGLEESVPYLVMEYAPDGTLRQRHPKGTVVPLSQIVKYVRQIASALQYAHTNRLIHRDVKPENILLGGNNKLLLGDFGAALLASTSLIFSTQNIIGTVAYMAPEQLRGKPTPASDQYALGIVVYEWICGYCPFQGSLAELHSLHLYEPPPSLCASIPMLSPNVEHVVMKALAKQPEQRFSTIWDFAQALEQASQQTQAAPLFLGGNGSSHNQVTAYLATPPILPPLPMATPQIMPTVPVEYIENTPRSVQPRFSRRVFVSSIIALAAIGSGGALGWLWTKQGQIQANSFIPIYKGHRDQVFTAAWSPNDSYIASAGGNIKTRNGDTRVHVWDTHTGQDVHLYSGHSLVVRMVAWSPDGTRIASAGEDTTVQIWDAPMGSNPHICRGHTERVMAVAWSHDNKRVASASMDGTVLIWDATAGTVVFPYLGHFDGTTPVGVLSVAYSPNGKAIASADINGQVHIWDAKTGKTLHIFSQITGANIGSLAWSPDGTSLVTGDYPVDNSVRIWNISDGNDRQFVPDVDGDQVYTIAWSPDGGYIAAGYLHNHIKILQFPSGTQKFIYSGHTNSIMSVQWSHNSTYIASCGFDKTVQIWTMS